MPWDFTSPSDRAQFVERFRKLSLPMLRSEYGYSRNRTTGLCSSDRKKYHAERMTVILDTIEVQYGVAARNATK